MCSQLELGPCFYPLWPNRSLLFLQSWWSEHHKHSLGAVTKSCPACASCLGLGQLQFPHQGCLCSIPQHRKLWVTAALCLWGAFLGSFGCLGSQGWECCLLWHWGAVEMNREKRVWVQIPTWKGGSSTLLGLAVPKVPRIPNCSAIPAVQHCPQVHLALPGLCLTPPWGAGEGEAPAQQRGGQRFQLLNAPKCLETGQGCCQ